ncbi:stomatal closure-related actin-binding protein 3-like [Chenopodium quinoa]|uniref:stomatal closure-related actin-binding protein 3-like n=1 Tax=Chenopodium quinoa TaxID=63459 RepID=UPI000B786BFA|nr:stomatal closure-related actin-binding protein 3-like [Chenopodium quinoa]XP_021745599.1 stomatal closure-related actin-binding protein 3-like [Chenopodium quinoa]
MTRVSPEFEYEVQNDAVLSVSADVSFPSDGFPKYKIGPNNEIVEEPKPNPDSPPLKEVVSQETEQLAEQHKRLSVRDLATKFDKNLAAAAKLSDEAKLRETASLEGHVLLKKLRDALESLKGCMAGRNKEDVEKAISMVEALAVKLTQEEGELIQEKFEVKKLANFLKQASEDAKRLVNQERSFACAEIESARAVVQRFGEALEEEEKLAQTSGKQDVETLVEEVQEARRIRLNHQPCKVMDMEHELRALRLQLREKSIFSAKLQKELAMTKRAEESRLCVYQLEGAQTLGSCLRIRPRANNAPDLPKCSIQWFRLSPEGDHTEILAGANKPIYAPEPLDVGKILQADVVSDTQTISVTTVAPIDPAPGLTSHVQSLQRRSNAEFHVVISQMNGHDYPSHSVHVFHVGKSRIKLSRGWINKTRESYSTSMQLCGVRGGGNAASKSLFWQPRKGLSYVLTFETERDRNAAIMIARKYALDCHVVLAGPDE